MGLEFVDTLRLVTLLRPGTGALREIDGSASRIFATSHRCEFNSHGQDARATSRLVGQRVHPRHFTLFFGRENLFILGTSLQ
jgi:hypothetical protein